MNKLATNVRKGRTNVRKGQWASTIADIQSLGTGTGEIVIAGLGLKKQVIGISAEKSASIVAALWGNAAWSPSPLIVARCGRSWAMQQGPATMIQVNPSGWPPTVISEKLPNGAEIKCTFTPGVLFPFAEARWDNGDPILPDSTTRYDRTTWVCPMCDRSFGTLSGCRRHIARNCNVLLPWATAYRVIDSTPTFRFGILGSY